MPADRHAKNVVCDFPTTNLRCLAELHNSPRKRRTGGRSLAPAFPGMNWLSKFIWDHWRFLFLKLRARWKTSKTRVIFIKLSYDLCPSALLVVRRVQIDVWHEIFFFCHRPTIWSSLLKYHYFSMSAVLGDSHRNFNPELWRGFISFTFCPSASLGRLIQSRHSLFKVLANLILSHEFPRSLTHDAICSRPWWTGVRSGSLPVSI